MFLNGGDALSGLGDAEGEHGEVVVVEQHHAVVEDGNFFAHIFQIGPQSDGGIRLLDIEEGVLPLGIADDGRIVPGIAILYPSLFLGRTCR